MRNRLKHVSRRHTDALAQVRWDRLEHLLADHYRAQRYDVDHVGTGGASGRFDGGIDLKLRRKDEYVLVQVKHWNAYKVPHNEVHQLIGLMVNERATGAILITSGEFTKAAIEAAARHGHVQLVDGHELRDWLKLPEASPDGPERSLGGRIAVGIGEHLAHAAFGRVAGHAGGGRRRSAAPSIGHSLSVSVGIGLAKLAVSLILFLILFVFIRNTMTSAISELTQPVRATPATTQRTAPAAQGTGVRTGSPPAPIATIRACEELVDAASGTYVNHCTRREPGFPANSNAAEPKGERKSAIEILSASTPEM